MHGDDEEHHGFDAEQLKEHDEHTKVHPPLLIFFHALLESDESAEGMHCIHMCDLAPSGQEYREDRARQV